MEDKQIVQLLFDRAETAISALAEKFGNRIRATAMNILEDPEDAEECVNDTYLAIWNSIPPECPNPLCAYVYRIGRNIALKHLRNKTAAKRNSSYDLSLEELSEYLSGGSLENALDARALGRAINSFLGTQSKINRILFLRRYWFGDSVKELSKATGMTPGAVSTRLNRIRASLLSYLNQEGLL